ALARLEPAAPGRADHLDAPGFAAVEIPDLEVNHVAAGVLQAVAEEGLDPNLFGHAVARVADRQAERHGVTDQDLLGGGCLDDQFRLADADLGHARTGEGYPGLRVGVPPVAAHHFEVQHLGLSGL